MFTEIDYKAALDEAGKYLAEKYGEAFTADSYEAADLLSGTDVMRFHSDGMDRKNEYIMVAANPNSPRGFSDNYFGYLIRPAMEAEVQNALGAADCKVYRENIDYCLPDALDRNSTVEALYRELPGCRMTVDIFLPADPAKTEADYRDTAERLERWMIANRHRYTVHLFVVSGEWYSRADRYGLRDFWVFYSKHSTPDQHSLFYVYDKMIKAGG